MTTMSMQSIRSRAFRLKACLSIVAALSIGCADILNIPDPDADELRNEPEVAQVCTEDRRMARYPEDPCSSGSDLCEYAPAFEPSENCECVEGNPTCHALYQVKVVKIDAEKMRVDLAFKKASNDPLPAGIHVWVVAGPATPSCVDLHSYEELYHETLPYSVDEGLVSGVPIWPEDAALKTDFAGLTRNIFIVTGGGDNPDNLDEKIWFQHQAITLQKSCF